MLWLKRILLALVGIVVLAIATVYAWGQFVISRTYPVAERTIILTARPEVLAEGERLAQVYGCFRGCHGREMAGEIFIETPLFDRIVAPNLTLAMERYSVSELEAIVRQGVKPDGHSVFGMPSASFRAMTDRELAAILSFIRQHPRQEQDLGYSRYGLMARFLMMRGAVVPEARGNGAPWQDGFERDPARHGEYLAMNACSECHGLELEGMEGFTPSLDVARAYSREAFGRLMSEGVGLGERDLGLMSEVAAVRFSRMKEGEVDALFEYLQGR